MKTLCFLISVSEANVITCLQKDLSRKKIENNLYLNMVVNILIFVKDIVLETNLLDT